MILRNSWNGVKGNISEATKFTKMRTLARNKAALRDENLPKSKMNAPSRQPGRANNETIMVDKPDQ